MPYYTMPFVDGETLRDRLRREGQLPLDEALHIARQIADAVGYAHARGLVHRDVKPENVLLSGGHALVADFGVVRALDPSDAGDDAALTSTGLVVGTPAYASPEQAGGRAVDARSDLYSLGCVLFEMLAGVPPFHGPTPQVVLALHQTAPPPRLRMYRATVPAPIEAAVTRAMAKAPADRFASADALTAALAVSAEPPRRFVDRLSYALRTLARPFTTRPIVGRPVAIAAVLALAGIVARATVLTSRDGTSTDTGEVADGGAEGWGTGPRLVVAPFTVVSSDSSVRVWREGMVDVLSTNLNDAGPLQTVPPTVADEHWPARADARSAAALARRTGARFALFGHLVSAGRDSVRLTATLLDLAPPASPSPASPSPARPSPAPPSPPHSIGDFAWQAPAERMPALTDSLSRAVLAALNEVLPIGAVSGAWLGSLTSSAALKAFLRGEQAYRRSDWGAAIADYERALAVDSTFAPALRRVATALGWQNTADDSVVQLYRLRAAAHNVGLPPRESLLVAVDSLIAASTRARIDTATPAPHYWRLVDRLFATLRHATARYPNDPEVWLTLGDAQYHAEHSRHAVPAESILANFDRAIALDSGFAPSYLHPVEIGLTLSDSTGLRYARRYLQLGVAGISADGLRLAVRLVEMGGVAESSAGDAAAGIGSGVSGSAAGHVSDHLSVGARSRLSWLDTIAPDTLIAAANLLDRWLDSGETALALVRLADLRRAGLSSAATCATRHGHWPRRLAYRGHLRDAWCRFGDSGRLAHPLLTELVPLAAPNDVVALFTRWLDDDSPAAAYALPWWSTRGDTTSIRRALAHATARTRSPRLTERHRATYAAAAANAYLALARGDSADARRRFAALPDTLCRACFQYERLVTARLLAAAGEDTAAAAILAAWPGPSATPLEPLASLERGRIAERRGDRAAARVAYTRVIRAWSNADPSLQPYVRDARAGLTRVDSPSQRENRSSQPP